jgi:hypothetical protein
MNAISKHDGADVGEMVLKDVRKSDAARSGWQKV